MKCVWPGKIEGELSAPHSKSVLQRAVAMAALVRGRSTIRASKLCDDDLAALGAASTLGAKVSTEGEVINVDGVSKPRGGTVDCGESGLCLRTFIALASLFDREFTLAARGSLMSRPVDMVQAPLRKLGAKCETSGGKPPVTVHGPIEGGNVEIDGSTTSQFLTGLLIALPRAKENSKITVKSLRSKPYIELTISLLEKFGIAIDVDEGMENFSIEGGQEYSPADIEVEGDWSGAAALLTAGAIAGKVSVKGLDMKSPQADRAILEALELAGANLEIDEKSITVAANGLKGFAFDAIDCPDLFPPLVALATSCKGISLIRGASRLRHKESDRANTLVQEFSKVGGSIALEGDIIRIDGCNIAGGCIQSHGDHRIAMALAIAALNARNAIEIDDDACVSKSYPGFFSDLEKLGARVT